MPSPDSHPGVPLDPDAGPPHLRPGAVAIVFVGGAIGTAARYGLAELAPTHPHGWPTGTFVANVLGAFLLGVLLEALQRRGGDDSPRRLRARLLGGTGFCGGFTTYSTFAVESALLVRNHDTGLAIGYLAASVVAGFVATVAGVALASAQHREST